MKNFLLLLILSISVSSLYAQYPCVDSYKINNGGGNCPLSEGIAATGKITLTFDGPVTIIPEIIDVTSGDPSKLPNDISFGSGTIKSTFEVEYCFYEGKANLNNLDGGYAGYNFIIQYDGFAPTICGDQIPLPVKLKSFAASRNNSNVELKWSTETEQNNSGFDIERLVGAGGWQSVGFVPAKKGDGNSVSEINYSFNDINPSTVITQYRLKQVDFDAKIIYSQVRAVQGIGQLGRTIVAPNPSSNGQVNVIFESTGERRNLQLTDMVGRLVKQWNGYADNSLQLTGLRNGIYQLRIVDAATGAQSVEKIVVSGK